jgi:hypothetical protein
MATTPELKAFIRGCKVRVAELESALANEYDKMATSPTMKIINSTMGKSSPILSTRASKTEKADHMALWMQSRGDSEFAELLQAFRRMSADSIYAAQIFAISPAATIADLTARGKSKQRAAARPKKVATKTKKKDPPRR